MSDEERIENPQLAELDQLLDGELPEAEAASCAQRLAEDGAVAEVLASLRADRDLRGHVWAQCLPSQAHADNFCNRTLGMIRKAAWQARWNRWVRVGGAAAACILVGFITGWSGRGHSQPLTDNGYQNFGPIQRVVDTRGTQDSGYYVELTDAAGHPVAVQHFANLTEAQAFARDLNHAQAAPGSEIAPVQLSPTPTPAQRPLVVPVSDEY